MTTRQSEGSKIGKRSDFAKLPKDQYLTPQAALKPLVPHIPVNTKFYEPCAGDGRMVDYLEAMIPGAKCTGFSDIDPWQARQTADEHFGGAFRTDVEEKNLFEVKRHDLKGASMFITNPPWTRTKASGYLLHRMIEHLSDIAPTWLLFDGDWLHTKQCNPYLNRLTHIVSVGRVKWIPDSKSTGKDNACWYRFVHPDMRTTSLPHFYGPGVVPPPQSLAG